ncbi:MAG: sigma-70 family RNA polymerase sigma factor [Clostridia bacterium]|nr:sigma-70 family RNA polymerase sigma factor [Clostridia bacterium]
MEELVEKAKNDDEKAFDEIIIRTKKEMYLIAKARLNNEEDIADVIQETILSCYKNLRRLKNNSYFKTWIIKILINECNKIYRKKGKNDISFEDKEMENYIKSNEEEIPEFDILINNQKVMDIKENKFDLDINLKTLFVGYEYLNTKDNEVEINKKIQVQLSLKNREKSDNLNLNLHYYMEAILN